MKYTFQDIRNKGLLLYEYMRGSQTYSTNLSTSDIDKGGVFLEPINQIIGLGDDFQEEISDEKHDIVWFSLKKYFNLLLKSNPNILESLFIDDEFVIYEHPIITELKQNKQQFLTQECFNSFIGYSVTQIKKAKGYNKLCNWEEVKRKTPLDFCYVPHNQGSKCMTKWLDERNLKQEYCGLISIPNMPNCFGVYYDWGKHIHDNGIKSCDLLLYQNGTNQEQKFYETYQNNIGLLDTIPDPIGYRGIIKNTEFVQGDDVRGSSIVKDVKPIVIMTYNKDAFSQHCKRYKQYNDWLKNRNENRYISNYGYNYDSKNMMHCFRLINMGIEIAKYGKCIVNRKNIDADFLLKIRNHEFTYEYLIENLENKKLILDECIKNTTLPEKPDYEYVNGLLIDIRKKYQLNF
jgi:hypothetical protein